MGTEEFWVPAALAAAGAGVSYVNSNNANKRQQSSEVQAIADQQALQNKANAGVKALTSQIATNTPDQIAKTATGKYVDVLRKNAAGTQTGTGNNASILFGQPTSSLPSTINGSTRYNEGTANSQNEVSDFGNQLATQMGGIDAPVRQRQNEGLAQSTLATNLNLLGANSYTKNFVDQLRSQASGVQSPWATLLSGVLGNAAKTTATNGTFASTTPTMPAGAVLGDGSSAYNPVVAPAVNPWFDTSKQSAP